MTVAVWNYYGIYPEGAADTAFWAIRGIIPHADSYLPRGIVTADKPLLYAPDTVKLTCTAIYTQSYQWQKLVDDVWVDITGETGSTLEITYLVSDDGYFHYRCTLTGLAGTSNTSQVTIDVHSGLFKLGRSRLGNGKLNKRTNPIILSQTQIGRGVLSYRTNPVTLSQTQIGRGVLSECTDPITLGQTKISRGLLSKRTNPIILNQAQMARSVLSKRTAQITLGQTQFRKGVLSKRTNPVTLGKSGVGRSVLKKIE